MKYKTYLYEPTISLYEKKFVNECLNTNWISSKGAYIDKFEKHFSKFIKIKHSISVCNGTAALHLALLALELKEGDEILAPSFTYISPINAIRYVGAKVKFVDSDLNNCQIDIGDLQKKITNQTKAIIVPHLYGLTTNIELISRICKLKKIFLIEDAAEAFGCYYKKKHLGTFGDISTFSFFGSKTITTGEGGMVCSNNSRLAKKIFKLKMVGVLKNRYYWHDIIGYNYRMTNISAAIGYAQLLNSKKILNKKKKVFQNYQFFLKGTNLILNYKNKNIKSSFWLINIFLKNKQVRDGLANHLKKNGIETRTTFNPVHLMPMFFKSNLSKLPNAISLSKTGLSLPSSANLKKNEIKFICNLINSYLFK